MTRYTTICLPLAHPVGFAHCVDAVLVHDIAPHLAHVATFAVHRVVPGLLVYWQCTQVETGMHVGGYDHSRDEVIERVRIILATKTPADIAAAVRAAATRAPWIVR